MNIARVPFGLTLLVACALLAGCPAKQEVIQPAIEKITESIYASGRIKTIDQYQVNATSNGIIQKLLVKEGDRVQKGDPIAMIKNEATRFSAENARLTAAFAAISQNTDKLNDAEANIAQAKIKMQNDSSFFKRQQNLWQQQIGTLAELEQKELAYKNSRINYYSAKLKYNELKKQLTLASEQARKNEAISTSLEKDLTLRSEVAGKVYSILKEKGEWVTTNTPVAIIGNATDFILELDVDENDITQIQTGQRVFVTMDSHKGRVFEAIVTKVLPIMNERTKSFTVEATFTLQPPVLYPNLTVEANIVIQTKDKALTIPRNYLVSDSLVLLADKTFKKVTIGLKDYQKVEILKGLSAADMIIKP